MTVPVSSIGRISDGSDDTAYQNDLDCTWVVLSALPLQIAIISIDSEADKDIVCPFFTHMHQ